MFVRTREIGAYRTSGRMDERTNERAEQLERTISRAFTSCPDLRNEPRAQHPQTQRRRSPRESRDARDRPSPWRSMKRHRVKVNCVRRAALTAVLPEDAPPTASAVTRPRKFASYTLAFSTCLLFLPLRPPPSPRSVQHEKREYFGNGSTWRGRYLLPTRDARRKQFRTSVPELFTCPPPSIAHVENCPTDRGGIFVRSLATRSREESREKARR